MINIFLLTIWHTLLLFTHLCATVTFLFIFLVAEWGIWDSVWKYIQSEKGNYSKLSLKVGLMVLFIIFSSLNFTGVITAISYIWRY